MKRTVKIFPIDFFLERIKHITTNGDLKVFSLLNTQPYETGEEIRIIKRELSRIVGLEASVKKIDLEDDSFEFNNINTPTNMSWVYQSWCNPYETNMEIAL